MKLTLQDRLLGRELGNPSRYSSIKGIYGDKTWIDELDIVNELGGHSGCVNALWSVPSIQTQSICARTDIRAPAGRNQVDSSPPAPTTNT